MVPNLRSNAEDLTHSKGAHLPKHLHDTPHGEDAPHPVHVDRAGNNDGNTSKSTALFALLLVFALILAGAVIWRVNKYVSDESSKLIREVTVEAGSTAGFDMFWSQEPRFASLVSETLDFEGIDYTYPQDILFNVRILNHKYDCALHITDTTAPAATAVPQEITSVDQIPDVTSCVTDISDISDYSVEWYSLPDISEGGNLVAQAAVTDIWGNQTIVDVPLLVHHDTIAPVIVGTQDITAYVGDTISYRSGVKVRDNMDDNCTLEIDNSTVDLSASGTYEVTYIATDFTGNQTTKTITLTLKDRPATYVEPELVYAAADEILATIITDDMTDMEKALQITWWCRYNLHYVEHADTTSWTRAAYDALVYRTGTCYSFAYAAKALFTEAGIESMIVKREPYTYSKHYWNYICIDGQWYHCDSTPRKHYNSYFFMYTSEELIAFHDHGWYGYRFDESKYPQSATESVQSRIDYPRHRIKD